MDRILTSGNGKGNLAILFWWLIDGALSVILCVLFFCVIFPHMFRALGLMGAAKGSFYCGLALIVFCLVSAALMHRGIAKTEINIRENGVTGRSVGRYFIWGDLRVSDFQLAYNQITYVEHTRRAVILYDRNSQYKCYVADPPKIYEFLNSQIQKALWQPPRPAPAHFPQY